MSITLVNIFNKIIEYLSCSQQMSWSGSQHASQNNSQHQGKFFKRTISNSGVSMYVAIGSNCEHGDSNFTKERVYCLYLLSNAFREMTVLSSVASTNVI